MVGIKVWPLQSFHLANETCSKCNTKGKLVMSIFGRYFHILGMKLFPIGRIGVASCMHCEQTLIDKEMPKPLRLQYNLSAPKTVIPVWTWTGLIVLVIVIALLFFFR